MAMTEERLASLTLFDYKDREILLIIMRLCEELDSPYVSTSTIAEALPIDSENPRRNVGTRLAVMRRMGMVEHDPMSQQTRWTVTPVGKLLASGQLKDSQRKLLADLPPAERVLALREIGSRYSQEPEAAKHMLKREWRAAIA